MYIIYIPILIYKDIMNNDVECFYILSHVVFFLIRPRFVEQLRQGSQELGSECAVASRQRLLLVFVLFICTQTCSTKHIPGIYISIVWGIGYFMDIFHVYVSYIFFVVISTLVFGCLSWIFFHKI